MFHLVMITESGIPGTLPFVWRHWQSHALRDMKGNKGLFYCGNKLIKANVCIHISLARCSKSYALHSETDQGSFLPTFIRTYSIFVNGSKEGLLAKSSTFLKAFNHEPICCFDVHGI